MAKPAVWSVCIFIAFLLLWEGICQNYGFSSFLIPAPSTILSRLYQHPERFFLHAAVTFKEMVGGLMIALCAAFPLAWLMLRWGPVAPHLQSIFVFIQCIPMFVLAPLMVFWFGWTYTAIIVPTALMIFFPLTITLYQGLRSTPEGFLDFFRFHQATPWQLLIKLQLPWSMPHLFAGLKISASIAGIGAVAGEWAGGQEGLGVLMLESRRAVDLPTLFSALFCLVAITLVFYGAIMVLERRWAVYCTKIGPALVICLCLLLGGCTSGGNEKSRPTRLLLDWLPNPNHVPLYVGIENKIFEKHGIDLQILKIQDPSDGIPFLASGQADISVFYTTETIRANSQGAHLQPIGVLINRPLNSLIYPKGLGINDPKDLQGKVIGYSSDGSGSLMLEHLLKLNGIQPKKTLNVSFDLIGNLGMGHVDAIFGAFWNIEREHLRYLGIDAGYFDVAQLGYPSYSELILIAREGSPQTSQAFVNAFQEALQESIQFCLDKPKEAFDQYGKANLDKSKETLTWERWAWEKTLPLLATSQQIDGKEWDFLTDWLRKNRYME